MVAQGEALLLDAGRELGVTHEAARARLQLSSAFHADGQVAAALLELDAARVSFEQLGAKADAGTARRLADVLSSKGGYSTEGSGVRHEWS